MKRIVTVLLAFIMVLGTFSFTADADEAAHILFEDDFSKEAAVWKLEGPKCSDGKLELHSPGYQWARLVDGGFLFYGPYTVEYDLTIVGGVDGNDDCFSITLGGRMFLFRLKAGTVHVSLNPGEAKIGNFKPEIGKIYRMKTVVAEDSISFYYKGLDDASYTDIGVYAKEDTLPSKFYFQSIMVDYDVDNIVFTSNGGDVVPDKKVRYLEVGETDKIVLTGSKAEGCTFESQKSNIISVEADGTITAKKPGGAKIDVKDTDGNIVECVYVFGVQAPSSLSFNFDPEKTASVYKDSNLYDEEKIVIYENDVCDLRVTIPSNASMKSINWSVEPADIVELWGSYTTSPTRTITGLKAGECVVTAKSVFGDAKAQIAIKVLPESEREIAETSTYDFYATGKSHNINKEIVGAHVVAPYSVDLTKYSTSEHISDLGIYSVRTGTGMVTEKDYDTSAGETPAHAVYRISNAAGVPSVCCLGADMVGSPETYDSDIENIVEYMKDIKSAYDGPIYIELFNEMYSIQYDDKFPTVDDYVDFCKKLIPKIKEVLPDAVFIACGLDYSTEVNVSSRGSDPENTGNPAYTQEGRAQYWSEKVRTLVDEGYVTGITTHPYQSIGSYLNGNIPKNNMKIRSAVVEMNYMSQLVDAKLYNYPDFYYTEWGQLEALIYWGLASGDGAEQKKYNYQKYPVAALYNMAQLLNYSKSEHSRMAHFHTLIGTDGFGIIDDSSTDRNYKIPNEIVFEQMSKVVVNTPVFYDLKPLDMDYVTAYRPAFNYFPDEVLQVANVESWGFGDESGLKQAAFFNQTDAPQKVKIGGTTLKPTWAYGGDTDKLMPEFLKNESYSFWSSQLTKDLPNSDAYTWLPETFDGAEFSEEIEIPPYTILFADVNGTPQTAASSVGKVCDLTSYAMRNSIVLGIGKSNAYVDNVEKQIDVSKDVTPVAENGETLLPLRFIAESFGCEVIYDNSTQTITVKDKNTDIVFTINETKYTVNGEVKELTVPAQVRDGRTVLPLGALAEALGKDVYQDDRGYILIGNKSIYIDREIDYIFDEISKLYKIGVNNTDESASFSPGYVSLYVGEACGLSVNTSAQNPVWHNENSDVTELFGDNSESKTVSALKPGLSTIWVSDEDGNYLAEVTVQVSEKPELQTDSASFSRGESIPIDLNVFGEHLITDTAYNESHKLVEENISFGSARISFEPGDDVTDYKSYARSFITPAMRNNLTLVVNLSRIVEDSEVALMEQVKAICSVIGDHQEDIYIEFGSGLMNRISATLPRDAYIAKCKSLYQKLKEYGVSIGKDIYTAVPIMDISGKDSIWNDAMITNQTYYDAVTPHLYTSIETYDGYTQNVKMARLFSDNENMYKTIEYVEEAFPGKDIWITEYATLDNAMMKAETTAEKARLQSSKTLGVALGNIEKTLNFLSEPTVKFANYHTPDDSQLFGIVQGTDALPNYHVFKGLSDILSESTHISRLTPTSVPGFSFVGTNHSGKTSVNSVGAYSFSGSNGLKYAVFINRAENPCAVSFSGNMMKPVWKYSTEHVLGEDYLRKTGTFTDLPSNVPTPQIITDSAEAETVTLDGYSMTICEITDENLDGLVVSCKLDGKTFVPLDADILLELGDKVTLTNEDVLVTSGGKKVSAEVKGSGKQYVVQFDKTPGTMYSVTVGNSTPITFTTSYDMDFVKADSDTTEYNFSEKIKNFVFDIKLKETLIHPGTVRTLTIRDTTSETELSFNFQFVMSDGYYGINWYTKDSSTANGGMGPSAWLKNLTYDRIVITMEDYVCYAYGENVDGIYEYLGKKDIKTYRNNHISDIAFAANSMVLKDPELMSVNAGTDVPAIAVSNNNEFGNFSVYLSDKASAETGILIYAAYDEETSPMKLLKTENRPVSANENKVTFSPCLDNSYDLLYKILYWNDTDSIKPITKACLYDPD